MGIRFDWQLHRELVLDDPSERQFLSFVEQGQQVEAAQEVPNPIENHAKIGHDQHFAEISPFHLKLQRVT